MVFISYEGNSNRILVSNPNFHFLSSAVFYRLSCPAVAAATCGRRCSVLEPLSRHRQNDPERVLRSATPLWDSFLHQKPRVGGTLGGSLRDGSDGWRSPVPRGEQYWVASLSTSSVNHPLSVPPTGCERSDESWIVQEMAGLVRSDGAISW